MPDPNAAASPTQIVEVTNLRMQVFHRSGGASCAEMRLEDFFGKQANEIFFDPRVVYDNVNNRFTVTVGVLATPRTDPHLTLATILRVAHTTTSDACQPWMKYSLETANITEGTLIDQPSIGQDRDAFLFGGTNQTTDLRLISYVAFSYPKACAYDVNCTADFPVFKPSHYATPATSGGNPMITTTGSYFVATVPNVGYELYRMNNSGDVGSTSFALEASISRPGAVVPPTRDPGQPGTATPINIQSKDPIISTRITSTPTYDGTRIWFVHQVNFNNHPSVQYGAISTVDYSVATAIVFHSPTSDDFNPSIAVALNGASRTIFLNWAYTDAPAGFPVTDTVATITLGRTDPPLPINGTDVQLAVGGLSADPRFGDYSSTMIDPLNFGQVCAVTAQQYADRDSGLWVTRISIFGALGC